MTETRAPYLQADSEKIIQDISPELLAALREVLKCGYGQVEVIIEDSKIKFIKKIVSLIPAGR